MAGVPSHRALRIGLAAAVLATLAAGAGGGSSVPSADAGVAPKCAYADTLTRYRARGDWYRSLLDTRYRLGAGYAPSDLVSVTRAGVSGKGSIRRIVLTDFTKMYRAARAAGAPFAVQSAYRSYTTQVSTFNRWVREDGYASALLGSARPGHSEHQLGTVLDLKTPGGPEPWDVADWGQTRAGSWIARNSWKYGFIVSYPKGKSPSATCYRYEPWHVRYFGRVIARKIHDSRLAAREWLYTKGATGTWTGGSPNPTPTPTPKPTPTPTPTVGPPDEPAPSILEPPTPSAAPEGTAPPDPGADPGAAPSDTPAGPDPASPDPSPGES
ncbi:MAG TPA: M15 family metallopeptidase [Candidatus Limnocylindrales bacterium]|nr:M15 family metallopeptidase [Candidatus Limnocylindrales bacterium]